ncbi:MAG: glycosyltransferase [Deltaproteobacteria bacterium]|nr:glycosyltransferase [Deltaproteobacteria bacterium]
MHILICGEGRAEIHEDSWAQGLRALGHEVELLRWEPLFRASRFRALSLARKTQNKLLWGPALWRLNERLVVRAHASRPDAIILYRPTHVWPVTVRYLRESLPETTIATYNNDDPFGPRAFAPLWRHYLAGVPYAHVHMVYRAENVERLRAMGASDVHVVRSAFLPERHRPIALTDEERARFGADVVFVGHFEPDARVEQLEALATSGVDLALFGPDWERAPRLPWLERFQPIRMLTGDDYVRAIAASRIALCFLSTLNRDTYTRRCFEIPAIGTMLLCQRTADMEQLFRPGIEADYFSDANELVEKVRHYLAHPDEQARIAAAGHARVHSAGHDITSRMREVEGILAAALARRRSKSRG